VFYPVDGTVFDAFDRAAALAHVKQIMGIA
jgi:hypothetical protein